MGVTSQYDITIIPGGLLHHHFTLTSKRRYNFLLPFSPKDHSLPTLVGIYLDMFETHIESGLSSLTKTSKSNHLIYLRYILYYFLFFLCISITGTTIIAITGENTKIHINVLPKNLPRLTRALPASLSTPSGSHGSSLNCAPVLL